jgi:hypothetical protein
VYDREFRSIYSTPPVPRKQSRSVDTWKCPTKAIGFDKLIQTTIFHLSPSTFICDEIYTRRCQAYMLYPMRDKATFVIGLTGTPLVTEPFVSYMPAVLKIPTQRFHIFTAQDLICLAHALRIRPFMATDVVARANDHRREIKNSMQQAKKKDSDIIKRAATAGDMGPATPSPYIATARRLQYEEVLTFKSLYSGRVLRRTPASCGRDGKPIIDLPPVIEHDVWVTLDQDHQAALSNIVTTVLDG